MFMAGQHRYGDFGNARVLEKSYLGGQLAMVVLLPADDVTALDELEAMLTDRLLDAWLEKLQDREVWLYLPKFRIERQFKLVESLRAMGIRRAFDREQANFSGMSEQREIYLADVLHKAFIDVAEQGTEAAAATVFFGGGMGGFEPPKPVIFRADHPFLFLIRDTRTGSILFLGRLNDPTAR
jgi:serpin B